jgi:hypothetical protein
LFPGNPLVCVKSLKKQVWDVPIPWKELAAIKQDAGGGDLKVG